jgi:hypothetical protein
MESRDLRLVIHSWDFDGMFADEDYLDKLRKLIISAADAGRALDMSDYIELAEYIVGRDPAFFDSKFRNDNKDKHVVYVGSDRQDQQTELKNCLKIPKNMEKETSLHKSMKPPLSSIPFFIALINVIRDKYDKYKVDISLSELLFEDIYRDLDTGTSFKHIRDVFLNELKPEFYAELAEVLKQGNTFDQQKANNLFMQVKSALAATNPEHNPEYRIEYTDNYKQLMMFTHIHHAHLKVPESQGIMQVVYEHSDDRRDILERADQIFHPNAVENTNRDEKSGAKNTTPPCLQFIPEDTEIQLRQFISPKELILIASENDACRLIIAQSNNEHEKLYYADLIKNRNILWGPYAQTTKMVGTCKQKIAGSENELFDIVRCTHLKLNDLRIFNPFTLTETIQETLELKDLKTTLELIEKCITALLISEKSKGIREIAELLHDKPSNNSTQSHRELLDRIIVLATKKLQSKSQSPAKGERFFRDKSKCAMLYKDVSLLSKVYPNHKSLEAVYTHITEQTQTVLPKSRRGSRLSRQKK